MREGVLAFFVCWFIGFLVYLFIEAPLVNLLYTLFDLRRRIELIDKAREVAEKERELKAKQLAEEVENNTGKQQKAKLAEPILDENANICTDYQIPDKTVG